MHLHNIDGVKIPFNKEWQHIGIGLSGGADSALLAFLICELAKESSPTIHVINHVRCWKTKPWQQDNANAVYNWMFQQFYHMKFVRHTNFIAPELEYGNMGAGLTDEYGKRVSGDNIQQRAYAEYTCKSHGIEAYYNAVTRNPRDVDFQGMTERDIERTSENTHLEIMQHMDVWALHPFRFVEKDWVIKQYIRLGLENLLKITRSCEGEFEGLDYTTYNLGQQVPVCDKCFWCKERIWAFGKNDLQQ